jgi:predicted membrane-bound mannosyltransferase
VLVVPTVAEVDAPWLAVHVVVPLSVPAAVGAARACTVVRDAVARDDAAMAAGALLVAVAVVAQVGGVLAGDVYARPTPQSDLAGYAQPADDLQPFAANVSAAGVTTGEPTVLYYGDRFHTGQWREADGPPVPERWGARLPLPWYVAQQGTNATSLPSTAALPPDPPPVVVTDPTNARAVQSQLRGYERSRYRLALWNREVVVFVRDA